jgi:SAM-dependent methyltransferase
MRTDWDYTGLAPYCDKKADYCDNAVVELLKRTGTKADCPIADIGAGTGKLTRFLLAKGMTVRAVEPNAEMRQRGIENTLGKKVTWSEGAGEKTGLESHSVYLVALASVFNLTDRQKTLIESARILQDGGWFACLGNDRDVEDPLQALVERTIQKVLPNYQPETRKDDPTALIEGCGLFGKVGCIESKGLQHISVANYVEAWWQANPGLLRSAGELFPTVVDAIRERLAGLESLQVPYLTRIWYAPLRKAS